MRDAKFREWLGRRLYQGKPLTTIGNRVGWVKAAERALPELGFPDAMLDDVHAGGQWETLLQALSALRSDWRTNQAAAKAIAPQSTDPHLQVSSTRQAVGMYGRFLDGADPNYDESEDEGSNDMGSIQRSDVEATMDEWDTLGEQGFLNKYNGSLQGVRYFVTRGTARYASKALANGTYQRRFGTVRKYNGSQAREALVALGYEVVGVGGGFVDDDATLAGAAFPADSAPPTNLILYGPPGTGKTYNTALEAVTLCDGEADYPATREGRAALMGRYNELVGQERIGFVTFHQNYGYEDFVEGLRPSTYGEDGEPLAAGFRLAPEAGIFTKMAERAEALRSDRKNRHDLTGKRFFKMSLGEVANPEDDYLFDEAIEGGFVHMGDDGGMDWSKPKFTTKELMIAGYAERHPEHPVQHPNNGIIEFPFRLRIRARVGDIIVVSKGNLLFRAIGEITGEYHQVPRENDDYTMRRRVKWLWIGRDGVSHDVIYGKRFSQRTIYELTGSELKLDAIGALIDSGRDSSNAGPIKQFVLIIDEINRANVSKVFGELITLLEPDKREGMSNALSVTLPYSKRPFSVPANLHIVGTMNTADRSIAQLDTALRRRFNFREMAPDPGLLVDASKRTGIDLVRVLITINQRIEYLIDREHRIGHAFFIGCETVEQVHATMRDKVIPLLQEYFFEDWSRIHGVLGDGFIGSVTLRCPLGEGEDRKSWFVLFKEQPDGLGSFSSAAFAQLIGKGASVAEPDE